jgi:hypothetical protein
MQNVSPFNIENSKCISIKDKMKQEIKIIGVYKVHVNKETIVDAIRSEFGNGEDYLPDF